MSHRDNDVTLKYQCNLILSNDNADETKRITVETGGYFKVVYQSGEKNEELYGKLAAIVPATDDISSDCCPCCGMGGDVSAILSFDQGYRDNINKVDIEAEDIRDIIPYEVDEDGNLVADSTNLFEVIRVSLPGDTIMLAADNYFNIYGVSKPITLKGAKHGNSVFNHRILVDNGGAVLDGLTFVWVDSVSSAEYEYASGIMMEVNYVYNPEGLNIPLKGDFTLKNCTFVCALSRQNSPIIRINAAGIVQIVGNKFINIGCKCNQDDGVSTWIRLNDFDGSGLADGSVISNNTFTGSVTGNSMEILAFVDNSHIDISNNTFDSVGQILFDNELDAACTISMYNNKWFNDPSLGTPEDEENYVGLICFNDITWEGQSNFSRLMVNVKNLVGPGYKKYTSNGTGDDQVYYVYRNNLGGPTDESGEPKMEPTPGFEPDVTKFPHVTFLD